MLVSLWFSPSLFPSFYAMPFYVLHISIFSPIAIFVSIFLCSSLSLVRRPMSAIARHCSTASAAHCSADTDILGFPTTLIAPAILATLRPLFDQIAIRLSHSDLYNLFRLCLRRCPATTPLRAPSPSLSVSVRLHRCLCLWLRCGSPTLSPSLYGHSLALLLFDRSSVVPTEPDYGEI